MNELLNSLPYVSAGASAALFGAIWQGAVLCAGVLICLRLLPGLSAAARSVIWFNVFVLVSCSTLSRPSPLMRQSRHPAACPRSILIPAGAWLSQLSGFRCLCGELCNLLLARFTCIAWRVVPCRSLLMPN